MPSKKITSLQALRGLAFLGIFFLHANFFINWAVFGVSVFFVMSGFLMMRKYGNQKFGFSIRSNFCFSISKIKKIYPLHIFTMLAMILFSLAHIIHSEIRFKSLVFLAGAIGLNITLLQTWFPHPSVNTSLNGVAWYLSVTMFLYFTFPYIVNFIQEERKRKKLPVICISFLILEIICCIPFIKIFGSDSPIYKWFMYYFPVFRLGDFFIGCCLGLFCNVQTNYGKNSEIKYSIMELTAFFATIGVFYWLKQEHKNIFLLAAHNLTTPYIPLAVIWVYLFTVNKGIVTRLLSNCILVYLGNISAYMFLIHQVVIKYINSFLNFLQIDVYGYMKAGIMVLELLISILGSALYMKAEKRIKKCFLLKDKI